MGKTPVDDFGLEVIRKAAQNSSDNTKYDLRSIITEEVTTQINKSQLVDLIQINKQILKELKIINIHLSIITDEEINHKDL